jgi:hypothetical protein
MRRPLTITAISLLLAGCAGATDKLADTHLCENATPVSQGITNQFFPSSSLNVPARSLLGGGKFDLDEATGYACIDARNNKNNAPQIPNPHKVRLDHLSSAI